MNVALLTRVRDKILESPEGFDMGNWSQRTECGTTHCIGGLVMLLSGLPPLTNVFRTAADLLGIDNEEARSLFFAEIWPTCFISGYSGGEPVVPAHLAAARINFFIATNGTDMEGGRE